MEDKILLQLIRDDAFDAYQHHKLTVEIQPEALLEIIDYIHRLERNLEEVRDACDVMVRNARVTLDR